MKQSPHTAFTPAAADVIASAGIVQAALAAQADYDCKELNKRLSNGKPLRASSTHRIAQAFADLARISKSEAFARLFVEVVVPDAPPEP